MHGRETGRMLARPAGKQTFNLSDFSSFSAFTALLDSCFAVNFRLNIWSCSFATQKWKRE